MLLSIVTVCYNSQEQIKKTLDSVAHQTFKNFEYLIIDGASNDMTYEIAKNYVSRIPNMKLYSEPDKGIYDAMNKGITRALGEYLYFLNAGDYLYQYNTLELLAEKMTSGKDLYYGQVMKGNQLESYPDKLTFRWLIYHEKMICHQAILAKRDYYEKCLYDLEYKICADRVWLLQVLKNGAEYERIQDITISYYDVNGASSHYDGFSIESLAIAKKYVGQRAVAFIRFKRLIGYALGHKRNI